MGISHSWNGTVLTITSDSGTSSADLKGDMGIRGPQGVPGVVDTSLVYTKDSPPTAAEVGAAPAGYVSEKYNFTDYASALTHIKNIYASMNNNEKKYLFVDIANGSVWGGEFPSGSYFVEIYREWDNYGIVEFISNAHIKIVVRVSGSWGDFCYENPSMIPGVEYRTTERWNGKPVYTKLVELGTLPNNSTKWLENMPLPMNITPLSVSGIAQNGYKGVQFPNEYIFISVDGEWGSIYIKTSDNYSSYSAYATIKYIKN
jgi:hypothetical protein